MSSIKKRLLAGAGANALGPIITATIQLGPVPILLHAWGAAKYGDWLIISAFPSYLNLSTLGFGNASGSDMTMRVAAGDKAGALRTFQSSWVLLLVTSALALAVLSPASLLVNWRSVLHLTSISNRESAQLFSLLALHAVLSQQFSVIESGFRCDGNFALGSSCGTLMRLIEAVIATAVGVITGNLVAVGISYVIARALETVGLVALLYHRSPWLRLGFRLASRSTIRQLAAPALGFLALPLGTAVSLQGFTILIGALLGPVYVTAFSTMRTLSRTTVLAVNMVATTVWPELSRAFGAGDLPLARKLHTYAYQLGAALSVLATLAMWLFGPAIYGIWTKHSAAFDPACFKLLAVVALMSALWSTSSVVLMASNSHNRLALSFLAATIVSFAIAWATTPMLGLKGSAAALLTTEIIMTWITTKASLAFLQEPVADFLRSLTTPPPIRSLFAHWGASLRFGKT